MTIHTSFGVVSHVRIAARVHERIRANTDRYSHRDAQHNPACQYSSTHSRLLFRMTFDTLEHRDVSEIDRVSKRFVCLVTRLALAGRQPAQIHRMLVGAELHGSFRI